MNVHLKKKVNKLSNTLNELPESTDCHISLLCTVSWLNNVTSQLWTSTAVICSAAAYVPAPTGTQWNCVTCSMLLCHTASVRCPQTFYVTLTHHHMLTIFLTHWMLTSSWVTVRHHWMLKSSSLYADILLSHSKSSSVGSHSIISADKVNYSSSNADNILASIYHLMLTVFLGQSIIIWCWQYPGVNLSSDADSTNSGMCGCWQHS